VLGARGREGSAPVADLDADGVPAARPTSRHQWADLASVIDRAVAAVAGEAGPGVRVDVDIDCEETTFRCDAFQIEQMLMQLLRNAHHAAAQGRGRVAIRLSAVPGGVDLCVEDDGPGMDEDAVERLFDPFAPPAPAGAQGGFGLTVSMRIVQAHGGEMRVESEPNEGTRVHVFLPGEIAASRDAHDA
jgi:signal transduction histidine kinase